MHFPPISPSIGLKDIMHMFRHRELSRANVQRFAVRSVEDFHDEVPRK